MTEAPHAPIEPREVARILSQIGTLMELNGRDPFRARAFSSAARALEGTDADLSALAEQDRLTELRGIGTGIAGVVKEIVQTGRSTPYEELAAATPVGLFDVMRVPRLGTKRIRTLHQELGIDSLDALEAAARAGKIAALPGMGEKTERQILEGIEFARAARGRRRYPEAIELGEKLLDWLKQVDGVVDAALAGQLRRRTEVVDRIDLVAAAAAADRVAAELSELNGIVGAPHSGPGGVLEAQLSDGLPVRIRVVSPDGYAAALLVETGSDTHVSQLAERATASDLSLTADGLHREGQRLETPNEEALYTALGLPYLPPELREGLGEIEAAVGEESPKLVALEDLRGTFHCHTTYSDGKASLSEMAEAAEALGWSYLGIADHSRTASYAKGLPIERLREQGLEIRALNAAADARLSKQRSAKGKGSGKRRRFRLFHGIESDILADGSLDYPPEVLAELDYVVGSVHSAFAMPEPEMTARVIRAVRNPALTILGHATGRLLLRREGYALDVPAVLEAAAESGAIVEINANPHRLDLDWRHVRRAANLGILIAINPDAHSIRALEHVEYGVNMARKAGLGPRQVLNCWSLEEVEEYLAGRKQAVAP